MSMSPSSGKVSTKLSRRPLMLRKCTLNNLPRSPNQRITPKNLSAGLIEHRRDRTLAEVEAVIGALMHRHKALEPIDRDEHTCHAAPSGRRIRIVRMTCEAHPGRGRYRYDRGKETVNTRPVLLLGDHAGQGG